MLEVVFVTKLHETWKRVQASETGMLGNVTPPKWVRLGKHSIYIYMYSFFNNTLSYNKLRTIG